MAVASSFCFVRLLFLRLIIINNALFLIDVVPVTTVEVEVVSGGTIYFWCTDEGSKGVFEGVDFENKSRRSY